MTYYYEPWCPQPPEYGEEETEEEVYLREMEEERLHDDARYNW